MFFTSKSPLNVTPVPPPPAGQVVIGSAPRELDQHDRAAEVHNLWIAAAAMIVALFPFVAHVSTGYPYADFAIVIFMGGAFGFSKRFLQDNQRVVNVPPVRWTVPPPQGNPTWNSPTFHPPDAPPASLDIEKW